MDDVGDTGDGRDPDGSSPEQAAKVHPFDDASRGADDESNRIVPREGRIDIVAEPVRYRRGPVYALLAVAVVPAIVLLLVHRWADERADAYEADRDRIEAERALAIDLVTPTETSTTAPTTTEPGGGALGDEADADAEPEPEGSPQITDLLDYRRAPSAIASLANARALSETLTEFSDRLAFGVCFAASVDGTPVAAHGSNVPLIPGSVQKLLTAAVALDVLGPDHVFETSVAVPTPVDGVVDGDIYLIGGGDPLLTSDDYPIEEDRRPAFNTTSFDALADAVVAAGVTRIRGTVIGDGNRYDDEFVVESWASGIAGVDAGPYDALLANDARVRGRSSRESDPNFGAAREFVRLLGNRGIQVDNGWGTGSRSTLVPIVGSVTSAPLTDVVEEMLVNSDNNTAEMLVKEIGFVASGQGTRVAGLDVMRAWLTEQGIATLGIELADGSGLSNDNKLTCDAVVSVLQVVDEAIFVASLPIAGSTGTLSDEFLESPLRNELRAKTGTLNIGEVDPPAVKSLAGYLPDDDGTIEFALIANTPGITDERTYRALWDGLAERLATYPAGPDLGSLGPTVGAEP